MADTFQVLTSDDACTGKTAKAEGDSAPAKYGDLSMPVMPDMFPGDQAATERFESNMRPDSRKRLPARIRTRLRL